MSEDADTNPNMSLGPRRAMPESDNAWTTEEELNSLKSLSERRAIRTEDFQNMVIHLLTDINVILRDHAIAIVRQQKRDLVWIWIFMMMLAVIFLGGVWWIATR